MSERSNSPEKRTPRFSVSINYPWCKNCGICVAFCPKGVFDAGEFGRPRVVAEEKCIKCMLCVIRCPDFAVDVTEKDADGNDNKT